MTAFINYRTVPDNVTIATLYAERKERINIPSHQRERVWSPEDKKLFIDTILRGYPVVSPIFYRDTDGKCYIQEGQQRLTTIIDFLDDQFPTITEISLHNEDPQWLITIHPNKTFSQLPVDLQRRFKQTPIVMLEITPKPLPSDIGVIYRRLNRQTPLTIGEELKTYSSETNTFAKEKLQHHYFFKQVYKTPIIRGQHLYMSLSCIAMEMIGIPVRLRKDNITRIAVGNYDEKLTEDFKNRILKRFDGMANIYVGSNMSAPTDILPMYQAVVILERNGYDLVASDQGALAPWFNQVKRFAQSDATWGFSKMRYSTWQVTFWERWERELFKVKGLKRTQESIAYARTLPQLSWTLASEERFLEDLLQDEERRLREDEHIR
jgi:hypothetical protein